MNVQTDILRVCGDYLSDTGVAYISYNTYPGWKMREIVRDAMLSEQAVEAGGKSVHHHFGQGNWERVTRNEAVLARWRGEDNTRPATGQYVATAKETITAALDALLGKETHDATD